MKIGSLISESTDGVLTMWEAHSTLFHDGGDAVEIWTVDEKHKYYVHTYNMNAWEARFELLLYHVSRESVIDCDIPNISVMTCADWHKSGRLGLLQSLINNR